MKQQNEHLAELVRLETERGEREKKMLRLSELKETREERLLEIKEQSLKLRQQLNPIWISSLNQ